MVAGSTLPAAAVGVVSMIPESSRRPEMQGSRAERITVGETNGPPVEAFFPEGRGDTVGSLLNIARGQFLSANDSYHATPFFLKKKG